MKNENQGNQNLNLIAILATIFVLIFHFCVSQASFLSRGVVPYFHVFLLSAILIVTPEFIRWTLVKKEEWYNSTEFVSSVLLLGIGMVGFWAADFSVFLSWLLWPLGALLLGWQIYQASSYFSFSTVAVGSLLAILLLFSYFGRGYEYPLFLEKIVLGKAHIDVLFFSSISSMISTHGVPSTGLSGLPYYSYHWGSHALFAGLKSWLDISVVNFYNMAYPAIFIGLYIKAFIQFSKSFFNYRKTKFYILTVLAILCFWYSLPLQGFEFAKPLGSGSLALSLFLTFNLLSIIIKYCKNSDRKILPIALFSFAFLLLISLTKVSTGFVLSAGLFWIAWRVFPTYSLKMLIVLLALVLGVLVYFFVFPQGRTVYAAGLGQRVFNFWYLSDGPLTFLLGLVIPIWIIFRNHKISRNELYRIFKSRDYLHLEFLFVVTLSGLAAGVIASQNPSDVSYFCITQFYLSLPVLLIVIQEEFLQFKTQKIWIKTFFIGLALLSVVSRPDLLKFKDGALEAITIQREMDGLSSDQKLMKEFLLKLTSLRKTKNLEETCLYIPASESWYYQSQLFRPLGALFVGPAISEMTMIQGIPKSILQSDINYYSIYFYKEQLGERGSYRRSPQEMARELGFQEIISFRVLEGKLLVEEMQLY